MEQNYVTNVTPQPEESKFKFPTEVVELPSKGLLYSKDNPLSSGKVEMKYMTAKEEDILTNQNYIKQGSVIDKLLQSLIVSKINYGDLLTGDKNAILVAARILGYGKDYSFKYVNRLGQEIEAVLNYHNIKLRQIRRKHFQKYLEAYNRALTSRDAEKYVDGEDEVVDFETLINEVALLRNKWLGIMKGLEAKQWQMGHIVRLRTAGMEDITIG